MRISGGAFVALLLALLGPSNGFAQPATTATVKLGVNDLISDAPFYMAQRKGFFAQQGIVVESVHFDTGSQMIPALATGQLDVGAGALSVGLFNAAVRGINLKIVADKARVGPNYTYVPIIVRKDLIDSGQVKTYADLKGLRIAEAGKWGTQASTINEALKKGGLTYNDVQHVWNLANPQHVTALANKAIDAALNTEPFPTIATKMGVAVRFSTAEIYPNQEIALLFYGGNFIKERPEVATKFMIAYLQGVRFYNDALVDGRFTGPAAPEVIDIITRDSTVKDKALFADMIANGCNPDGYVNLDSINKDIAFYKWQGVLEGNITAQDATDHSFVDRALAVLGPYKPKR